MVGMQRSEIIDRLKAAEEELRRHGVAALYLFGSHARDEAGPQSDVDVFVEPRSDEDFGFLEFMGAYDALRRRFDPQTAIGYSTRDGISKYLRDEVEREAIKIF